MEQAQLHEQLVALRNSVEGNWLQCSLWDNEDKVGCLTGHIAKVCDCLDQDENDTYCLVAEQPLARAVAEQIKAETSERDIERWMAKYHQPEEFSATRWIWQWNDDEWRSEKDVLKLIDSLIAKTAPAPAIPTLEPAERALA